LPYKFIHTMPIYGIRYLYTFSISQIRDAEDVGNKMAYSSGASKPSIPVYQHGDEPTTGGVLHTPKEFYRD